MLQIASETIARDAPRRRASRTAEEDADLRRLGRSLEKAEARYIAARDHETAVLVEFARRLPEPPEAMRKGAFTKQWLPEDGYYSLEDVRRIASGQRKLNGHVSPDWKEKLRIARAHKATVKTLQDELGVSKARRARRRAEEHLESLRNKIGEIPAGGVKGLAVRIRALVRPELMPIPEEPLAALEEAFEAARAAHIAARDRHSAVHAEWCRLAPYPHENIRVYQRGRARPPSDTLLPYPEARDVWSAEALRRLAKRHPGSDESRMAEEDIPLAEAYAAGMAEAERVTRRLELQEQSVRLCDEVHAAAARLFAAPAATLADFAIKARVLKRIAFIWWEHGEDNPHHRAAAQLVDALIVFAAMQQGGPAL